MSASPQSSPFRIGPINPDLNKKSQSIVSHGGAITPVIPPLTSGQGFQKPTGKPGSFGDAEPKITKERIDELEKLVAEMKKLANLPQTPATVVESLNGLTDNQIDLFNAQAEKEKLQPLKVIKRDPPFYVIPILDGIPDPLSYTETTPNLIIPASDGFFKVLDKMRSSGWPVEGDFGIRYFLDKAAESIKLSTGLECKIAINKTTSRIVAKDSLVTKPIKNADEDVENYAEFFCNWFPSSKKHELLYKEGLNRLKDDIREQFPDAFLPENYEELMKGNETNVCPPKQIDFVFNGKNSSRTIRNVLRHFTEWDKNSPLIRSDAFGGVSSTYECTPPLHMQNSWIPEEYIQDQEFMAFYNLQRFEYMDTGNFQKLLYNIIRPIDISKIVVPDVLVDMTNIADSDPNKAALIQAQKDDMANTWNDNMMKNYLDDASGTIIRDFDYVTVNGVNEAHAFITINDKEGKKSFKVFNAELELNYPPGCEEDEAEILLKKDTLRTWCQLLDPKSPEKLITRFYPFLYVVLNSVPPDSRFYDVSKLGPHIYDITLKSGKSTKRMYSSAPLSAFQASMIKRYGTRFDKMDTPETCLDKFKREVWQDCLNSNLIDFGDVDPDEIPEDYSTLITKLFQYGGNTGCSLAELKQKEKENTSESINNPKNEVFDIADLIKEDVWRTYPKITILQMGKKFEGLLHSQVTPGFDNLKNQSAI